MASRRGKTKTPKPKYTIHRSPFYGASKDDIASVVKGLSAKSAVDFESALSDIRAVYHKVNPAHIVATIATYSSRAHITDDGVVSSGISQYIQQHHVELLLALTLVESPESWGKRPPNAHDIQIVLDKIQELTTTFHRRRLGPSVDLSDEAEKKALVFQEMIRLRTQHVRNWGYFKDVLSISLDLYKGIDGDFRRTLGYNATDVIRVAEYMLSEASKRMTEHFKMLLKIFRKKTIEGLVREYYKIHPLADGDPQEFIDNIPFGASFREVQSRLLSHSDLDHLPNACFSAKDIATKISAPEDEVQKILASLSISPGDLKDKNIEHLFMDNPVWTSPFINLGELFFCPMPQLIFSNIHAVMRMLSEKGTSLRALEDRRATYLEGKIAEILRKIFPEDEIKENTKWKIGGVEYETDILTQVDTVVLLVEAKSGHITAPALRGAADRLKRHIKELIVDPSEQSSRLESLIFAAKSGDSDAIESIKAFQLDLSKVEFVVRISVTLDDMSFISAMEADLKEAFLAPVHLNLATTVNIADFGCVADLLNGPARFLHYFIERQRIQKKIRFMADELDLLGFYLDNSFNVGGIEDGNVMLVLTGKSEEIDKYYNGRDAGLSLKKPQPKARPYFEKLIKHIENKKIPFWTLIVLDILRSADYDEQRKIERGLSKLKASVPREWKKEEHESCLIITPPAGREAALMFYVYPPELADKRRDNVSILADQALEISKKSRCIAVGRQTKRWDEPYTFLMVAYPDGTIERKYGVAEKIYTPDKKS